jgi:uncharacterized RDD family membrane protein YckC
MEGSPMATPMMQPVATQTQQYGGFLERFVAVFIDGIVVGIVLLVVRIPLAMVVGQLTAAMLMIPVNMVAIIAYEAYFIGGPKQATFGKQAMGLIVTDLNGQPIDMQKAAIRSASKILSALILAIGYIMAIFTAKKQTLHDLIANTIVVKGKK